MKIKRLQSLTSLAQITLAAATLLTIVTPSIAQAEQSPLQLTVSLDSPTTITQGEPIILRYRVTNLQETHKTCSEKPHGQDWLTESLVDAAGHAVPHVTQFDPQRFAGGFQIPLQTFPVPASGAYDGYEVTNQRFGVPAPGRYTLTVHATLINSITAEVAGPSGPDTLIETFSFPLVVTPADSSHLASVANFLTDAILAGPDITHPNLQKRSMQIRSLFSMPSSIAAPFWVQVAQHHVDVGGELYRAHTAGAAEVLAFLAADQSVSREEAAAYLLQMDHVYGNSDAGLRQHITSLYPYYGLGTPKDRRIEPVVTN